MFDKSRQQVRAFPKLAEFLLQAVTQRSQVKWGVRGCTIGRATPSR
jgi:hypothetical protein